ncbi:MAG: cyclic nucleotide-binding domain-containing protein [Planctomycetia bacterium]|jgi:CRP-like cAMP-binding protein|nr:cyclic nucleotide-binding domain-containing protein [Planctomycetia bacterium]MCC7313798.1 cyclic nucleotide-binding domain-containing protein [Planctomycetota bacterium]
MNESYENIITSFPLFQGFTPAGAKMLLDRGEVKTLPGNQTLFKEGDPPAAVLLVLTGMLDVFVERHGRDMVLTQAGPGAIVGELAVLCGIPRSASVRASGDAVVLELSSKSFRSLLLSDAFLSERVFRQSLRTLIDKEQSLIESVSKSVAS